MAGNNTWQEGKHTDRKPTQGRKDSTRKESTQLGGGRKEGKMAHGRETSTSEGRRAHGREASTPEGRRAHGWKEQPANAHSAPQQQPKHTACVDIGDIVPYILL